MLRHLKQLFVISEIRQLMRVSDEKTLVRCGLKGEIQVSVFLTRALSECWPRRVKPHLYLDLCPK